jgi:hypothetical protein
LYGSVRGAISDGRPYRNISRPSFVYTVPIPIAITQPVVRIVRLEVQARPHLSRTEP